MIRFVCALALSLLAGCETFERQAQQQAAEQAAARERYHARLNDECARFGFPEGTPAFSQCLLQLHQGRQQEAAALGAALIGSGMLNPRPAYAPIPYTAPIRQPRTTCNRLPGSELISCTTQ